ncbi:MAG: IS1634 family transposase, partial [Alteromonadaceae bacterium]|nr:IS1634 family transposase [Alteromonadaceae bacterium]
MTLSKNWRSFIHHLKLPCESVHLDSTSFHYDGEGPDYEDIDANVIRITKGYSRDHRPDLNQVVLNFICENQSGIPVYMKPASGNINDLEGFKTIVKSHIKSLKAAQASRYLVADAALYVKETIEHLDTIGLLFITRVPQKLKETKTLIAKAPNLSFKEITEGYQGVWYERNYGGVAQKWLLIRSEQALKREHHNLNKRMIKQSEQARKAFKKLSQQEFACDVDALKAVEQWESKQPYLKVETTIIKVPVFAGASRPSLNQKPEREYYKISGNLYTAMIKRQDAQQQLGLFTQVSEALPVFAWVVYFMYTSVRLSLCLFSR